MEEFIDVPLHEEDDNDFQRGLRMHNYFESITDMSLHIDVNNETEQDSPDLNTLECRPDMSLHVNASNETEQDSPNFNNLEPISDKSPDVHSNSEIKQCLPSLNILECGSNMSVYVDVNNETRCDSPNLNLERISDKTQDVDTKKEIQHNSSIPNNLESICQDLQKSENIRKDGDRKERTEELQLLIMTNTICEVLRNLNEHRLQLVSMELKKFGKGVDISREEMESFISETNNKFLKFHEAYNKFVVFLEDIFQNVKNEQHSSSVQNNCQKNVCESFSISEEDLASYVSIFDSSKKHFREFESSLENDLEICCQDCENTFKSIKDTFNKATIAGQELISVAIKLANYE